MTTPGTRYTVSPAPPQDKTRAQHVWNEPRWIACTSTHRHLFPSPESAMAFQELLLLRFMLPVIEAHSAPKEPTNP